MNRYNNAGNAALVLLIIFIISVVVLIIVAWCKLFKKAGYHPGMFFIPVYGGYLCYKIADSGGLFFGQLAVSIIANFISQIVIASSSRSYYSGSSGALAGIGIVYIIAGIILLIINIAYAVNLARCFGKSGGFAAGLFFLYPIFLCILAFGSAQHYNSAAYSYRTGTTGPSWKCPDCGAENPAYKGVCECGTKKP